MAEETIDLVLSSIELAARDTHLFGFARPDGSPLPAAEAGAHIGLHLPNGLERQYSLVHPCARPDRYTVGIKNDPASRGGSRWLHEEARVGMVFPVSPPRNNFPLNEAARHSVLFAGGIGITPIYAMIERLDEIGAGWSLVHACRSGADAAFAARLKSRGNVRYHFDEDHGGKPLDIAAEIAAADPASDFYCCGPTPMLAAFEAAAEMAGIAPERVHVEYFTQKFEASRGGGFTVELARSGQETFVEEGQSILQAVQAMGVDVPFSCEEGICGSCETSVLSGLPDHRDAILTEAEREESRTMMICCSGCKSDRLVLDL